MSTVRKPHALPSGGTIGIIAPAGPVDSERLAAGEESLKRLGYQTRRREDLLDRKGYLAGEDERRALEFMEFISSEEVDAIFCARGGYGCHRIIASLDAEKVARFRKPLVGYSDITTLLLWQWRQAGLAGFHGPMLEKSEGLKEEESQALVNLLSGRKAEGGGWGSLQGRSGSGGKGQGPLVGGSLTLLVASLGTEWEPELSGAILMLEEVNEPPYRLDRMLHQLKEAGKLDGIQGVGVGSLKNCEAGDNQDSPQGCDVVAEVFEGLSIPLVMDLPFGHGHPNLPWPLGIQASIHAELGEIRFEESAVE